MRVLCVLVIAAFLATGALAQQRVSDGLAVIVNDALITYQDVARNVQDAVEILAAQYARQPAVLDEKIREVRAQATEDLVNRQLILHDYKTGGYNYPETVIEDEIQRRIKEKFRDRATLLQGLREQGITYEAWKAQRREEILVIAMQQLKVPRDVLISPQKILDYYETHKTNFMVGEQVKLRTIVLNKPPGDTGAVKQLAEEILRKLKEGASFAEMAKIHSDGAAKGGEAALYERDGLRKELANVAFSLKAGERSGVIDLPDSCWLMQVEENRPAHTRPLSEVRDDIERTLRLTEAARVQKKWLLRLKEKAFVRYF